VGGSWHRVIGIDPPAWHASPCPLRSDAISKVANPLHVRTRMGWSSLFGVPASVRWKRLASREGQRPAGQAKRRAMAANVRTSGSQGLLETAASSPRVMQHRHRALHDDPLTSFSLAAVVGHCSRTRRKKTSPVQELSGYRSFWVRAPATWHEYSVKERSKNSRHCVYPARPCLLARRDRLTLESGIAFSRGAPAHFCQGPRASPQGDCNEQTGPLGGILGRSWNAIEPENSRKM
jgi:hypothetical protein